MPASQSRNSRLVEHAREGVDRQVQVAVLLHVEVDEHGRRLGRGDVVHGAQAIGDALELVVEGEHVEVGAQGRDLHRHVVDVGPPDPCSRPRPSRAAASSSPRIASPSTLTLRSKPAARRRARWRANAGSPAGTMTPWVSARMRWRTIAATGRGVAREASAAARRPSRSRRGSAAVERRRRRGRAAGPSPAAAGGVRRTSSVSVNSRARPSTSARQAAQAVGAAALGAGRPGDGSAQQALGEVGGRGDPVGATPSGRHPTH